MIRRRGFTMVMALACAFLVAASLAVTGVMLASQGRRTRLAEQDAQLRQLLLAGQQIARSRLPLAQAVSVNLPQALKDQGASLAISPSGENSVEIQASLPHRRASELLRFEKVGGNWRLASAALGE